MTNIHKLNVVLNYLERGYSLPYDGFEISSIGDTFYAGKIDEKCYIIDPTISSLLKFVELLPKELIDVLSDFLTPDWKKNVLVNLMKTKLDKPREVVK